MPGIDVVESAIYVPGAQFAIRPGGRSDGLPNQLRDLDALSAKPLHQHRIVWSQADIQKSHGREHKDVASLCPPGDDRDPEEALASEAPMRRGRGPRLLQSAIRLADPSLKVLSVRSAKGLEFPVSGSVESSFSGQFAVSSTTSSRHRSASASI
jgi:hypothetical protein